MSKTLSLRDAIAPILIGVGVAVSVIACSPTHSTPHPTPGQSAAAKSDAKALSKCLPTGATQQIELAHSLTTHSGREALAAKCGVPPQHKAAFESQLLAAAEAGHLTTHAGRTTFFNVTVVKIIEANQG